MVEFYCIASKKKKKKVMYTESVSCLKLANICQSELKSILINSEKYSKKKIGSKCHVSF